MLSAIDISSVYLLSLEIFAFRSRICKHYGVAENGKPKSQSFSVFLDFLSYISPEIFVTVYRTTETTLWGTTLDPVTCCINHFHTAFTRWKTEGSLCISDKPASSAVLSNCTHSCHDWAFVIRSETVTLVNIHIRNFRNSALRVLYCGRHFPKFSRNFCLYLHCSFPW
jgi:hypothetical protein